MKARRPLLFLALAGAAALGVTAATALGAGHAQTGRARRSAADRSRSPASRTRSRSTRRPSSRTSRSGSSSRSTSRSTRSAKDGKSVEPVARDRLHDVDGRQDLHLQAPQGRQVLERPADDLRRRQVLDRRRPRAGRRAGATSTPRSRASPRPTRDRSSFHLKYPWAPFLADIVLFANGIIPNNFGGQTRAAFYKHPIGTGPFMWDKRVVGQSVTLQAQPVLLAEGQAVPRQRHLDLRDATRTPVSCSSRAARPRSTSSRRSTRSRS